MGIIKINKNIILNDIISLFFRLFFKLLFYFIIVFIIIGYFKYGFKDYVEHKTNNYTELSNIKDIIFDKGFYTGKFRKDIKKDIVFISLRENLKPELMNFFYNIFINYQYLDFNKKFSNYENNSNIGNFYKNGEYVKIYKTLSVFNIKKEGLNIPYNPINIEYGSTLLHETIHLILSNNKELKQKATQLMIQMIKDNKYITSCIKDKICNDFSPISKKEKNDYIIYGYFNNILNIYSGNNSWLFYKNVFSGSLSKKDNLLIEELIAFSLQNSANRENIINNEYGSVLINLFFDY